MEKKQNTKEDIEFLKKFRMFVIIVGLSVGILGVCKCSADKAKNTSIDYNGIITKENEENSLVLRRIK